MNLAVIDVGSNNIKLEIHEIDQNGKSHLIFQDKLAARLGHEVFLTQRLSPENIKKAIEGLKNFAKICRNFRVNHTIALGTAALRETDPRDFIRRVQKETGIQINVIPGIQEAKLVYSGALATTDFQGRRFLLNDIGGGSTEISVADHKAMYFVESFRLGTVRLKEMFQSIPSKDLREVVEVYIRKSLQPYRIQILDQKPVMGLSTGGTARNIMEILLASGVRKEQENDLPVMSTVDLRKLVDDMTQMSQRDLQKLKGLDPARADIILPGSILLLTLLDELRIEKSLISSKGLRDGAVADYVHKRVNKKIYFERQLEFRKQGLRTISSKFNTNPGHAEQVARLSEMIHDALNPQFHFRPYFRDILFGAALLHDIGNVIDYSNHHKHSEYMIRNSRILGFTPEEQNLIALTARYHRKGLPKSSHSEYQRLTAEEQECVLRMSAILRLADALDRSYSNAVKSIRLGALDAGSITLIITGKPDLSLELWSLDKKKEYFEKVFERNLFVETRKK